MLRAQITAIASDVLHALFWKEECPRCVEGLDL